MTSALQDIVCPDCGAGYQVPQGAIGPKGRRLVCSMCGTEWRAMPGGVGAPGPASPPAPGTASPPARGPAPMPAASPAPMPAASPAPMVAPDPARMRAAADAARWDAPTPGPAPRPGGAVPPPPPAAMPPAAMGPAALAMPDAPRAAAPMRPAPQQEQAWEDDIWDQDGPAPMAPPASPERAAQMAELRQMLAEIKPSPAPVATPPAPPPPAPPPVDLDDIDPLRARLAQHGGVGRAHKPDPVKSPYDRAKLMRTHDKKMRRRKIGEKRGSGAFVTGFLLMLLVAGAMTALYILHPQIIARLPGTEAALLDYVATVDSLRLTLAETTQQWTAWVNERLLRE